MASVVQEPEVQFAQRLASNEKSVRTKAIKKLRKYLSVRSQKPDGGFSLDELLKIWKGLFYCLWMQDKPLLQEELSNQISGLIHWLQNVDTQFLFLESFLMTINREWNGIDRLRMDKFYSLVRFVFREAFEMLKKRDWDDGLIGRFLELVSALVLRGISDTPKGVQFHVLDIYMTELARVGSAQLTAEQNLAFIEPFCKTAARSKDHILVEAICSNIFQEMVEQAPFAIDDLMRELRSGGGGGPDSEEDLEAEQDEGTANAAKLNGPRKIGGKLVNGVTSTDDDDDDDDDDDGKLMEEEDDGLPDWGEDSDVRADHEGAGPVLQFDYQAVGDKLFALASRNNTPSFNRKKLYQLVRTFRNLSKGIFPQDDYPPEVSTDEDDDMFASRKKMKKKRRRNAEDQLEEEADDEGVSAVKKRKVKKDGEKPAKSAQKTAGMPNDGADAKKKKRRQKKKKKKKNAAATAEGENRPAAEVSEKHPAPQTTATAAERLEIGLQSSPVTEAPNQSETGTETPKHCRIGAEGAVADIQPKSQSETPSADGPASGKSGENRNKKKKKRAGGDVLMEDCERPPAVPSDPTEGEGAVADGQAESQSETLSTDRAASGKATEKRNKKKKKKARGGEEIVSAVEDSEMPPCAQLTPPMEEEGAVADGQAESQSETLSTDCAAAGKGSSKKNKSKKRRARLDVEVPEPDSVRLNTDTSVAAVPESREEVSQSAPASKKRAVPDEAEAATPLLPTANGKRSKKKKNKKLPERESSSPAAAEELTQADAGSDGVEEHLSDGGPAARLKKRKRKKVSGTRDEGEATGAKAARLNGHMTAAEETRAGEEAAASSESDAVPALSGTKKTQKKKKKKAVAKALPGGASDFVQFQSPVVPTPLFCRGAKGGPSTPTPRKQLSLTSSSESKKVTFGLKNNQTAEFKKTDRSLMVSPDGSSRVPFDPQQKPLFGVLKSPNVVGPQATKNKNSNGSTGRRPTAADFF
ncbi:hypothetical protein GJAV_G00254490 [Gymnothorax javanicus]|nr:hypothetical protein GJAV_G00254490 [Gymnothorax javanicus]